MTERKRLLIRQYAEKLLPKDESEWLKKLKIKDAGFGYDIFGFEPESAFIAYYFFNFFYKYWFRVESTGIENIPATGRAILTPNHSGTLPIDYIMIAIDIIKKMKPPRIARGVVDHFAGALPFINTMIYRCGSVIGSRKNTEYLLKNDDIIIIFPEGTKGIGKPFTQKYKLVRFNVGFVELALKTRSPIVPVAVIGAEEQAPQLFKIKWLGRLFGFPYIPVTPTFPLLGVFGLIPLPVKYHIYYGKPFYFSKKYSPRDAQDPEKVRMLANIVQDAVQELINNGLKRRKGIF